MNGRVGSKDSLAKAMVAELRENFDELINPITGGKNSSDPLPDLAPENLHKEILPLFKEAFITIQEKYEDLLGEQQALDFDDLEFKALELLKQKEIREHWQNEVDALLVDEFQDTNRRQQEIIEALAGKTGSLFIVGDMRQSIYRFRQADVTVFKVHDNSKVIRSRCWSKLFVGACSTEVPAALHDLIVGVLNLRKLLCGEIDEFPAQM